MKKYITLIVILQEQTSKKSGFSMEVQIGKATRETGVKARAGSSLDSPDPSHPPDILTQCWVTWTFLVNRSDLLLFGRFSAVNSDAPC